MAFILHVNTVSFLAVKDELFSSNRLTINRVVKHNFAMRLFLYIYILSVKYFVNDIGVPLQ